MNPSVHLVLCMGMAGAAMLTMFWGATGATFWKTQADDPEHQNMQKGLLAFAGVALILLAAVVAPCTGPW